MRAEAFITKQDLRMDSVFKSYIHAEMTCWRKFILIRVSIITSCGRNRQNYETG